jgi:hypothetical protein
MAIMGITPTLARRMATMDLTGLQAASSSAPDHGFMAGVTGIGVAAVTGAAEAITVAEATMAVEALRADVRASAALVGSQLRTVE